MTKKEQELKKELDVRGLWNMDFDGVSNKGGVGGVTWIKYLSNDSKLHSFKLDFECINNEAEYEALISGLNILKYLVARRIDVYEDSELLVNQVNGTY